MSLVHHLKVAADGRPTAEAIKWRHTVWTYGDLMCAVNAVKVALERRELDPGARIALLLRNSPHYAALYYGILAAGYVAIPLNPQERFPALARQIEHSQSDLLIGDREHPEWAPLVNALTGSSIELAGLAVRDGSEALEQLLADLGVDRAAALALPDLALDRLATILYTSGTTGRPKGVMLSHRNLVSNATAIIRYLDLRPDDRTLCLLPFQFAYGSSILHTHMLAGSLLVLEDNFAFPRDTLRKMQEERITGFAGVPSTFALLLSRCRLTEFDLSLRWVTQAGGAMPRALLDRLSQELADTRIFVMYGQTEATARLTYLPPERLRDKPGSVGIPVDGVQIEVRRSGRPAPPNVVGEIFASGPNVMLGYWRDPEGTAQTLVDGWLRTGDLGHLDEDGYLYIDGRAVEMIKTGAFRVTPLEVEEVIAAMDGVEEVAVTAIPDELLGQAVKAVVVCSPGANVTDMQVKAHCRRHLAAYKVPKVVEFTDALPRTASGKVQRMHL